jgi:hypothetical protein
MALVVCITQGENYIHYTQAHDKEESSLAVRLKPTLTADQQQL